MEDTPMMDGFSQNSFPEGPVVKEEGTPEHQRLHSIPYTWRGSDNADSPSTSDTDTDMDTSSDRNGMANIKLEESSSRDASTLLNTISPATLDSETTVKTEGSTELAYIPERSSSHSSLSSEEADADDTSDIREHLTHLARICSPGTLRRRSRELHKLHRERQGPRRTTRRRRSTEKSRDARLSKCTEKSQGAEQSKHPEKTQEPQQSKTTGASSHSQGSSSKPTAEQARRLQAVEYFRDLYRATSKREQDERNETLDWSEISDVGLSQMRGN